MISIDMCGWMFLLAPAHLDNGP